METALASTGPSGHYPILVIDTHCHLTFRDFEGRIGQVLDRASEADVLGAITISTTSVDCLHALEIAHRFPNVWCSAGVHPLHSDSDPHLWDNLGRVARDERCVAWGELGLDNHYPEPARAIQDAVLADELAYIEAQEDIDLPVVVHCREAFEDLVPILRASSLDPHRFVFHCFTGGPDDARLVLDFGAWISFTGVVTYKNAAEVQEAARLVPGDRIMVETDAPFLSPVPHRGTRPCEPWMSSCTARFLAELRGEAWDEFHQRIDDNVERFFGIRVKR